MTTLPTTHASPTVQGYVWAVVLLAVITMAAILTVSLVRPDADNGSIYAQITAVTGPVIAGLIAMMVKSTHDLTNSRMDEFKEVLLQVAKRDEQKAFADGRVVGAASAPSVPVPHVIPVVGTVVMAPPTEPIPVKLVVDSEPPKP